MPLRQHSLWLLRRCLALLIEAEASRVIRWIAAQIGALEF
jgi:hypothetical protein